VSANWLVSTPGFVICYPASMVNFILSCLGRLRITWMKTIQQDLKSCYLNMHDAVDLAQNHLLWRLMSTFGATHS